jgi:hypothetical protein
MAFQNKTLFQDPTPDGYINLRYVVHMMNIAQTYTDFTDGEFQFLAPSVYHLLVRFRTATRFDNEQDLSESSITLSRVILMVQQSTDKFFNPVQMILVEHNEFFHKHRISSCVEVHD